MGKKSALLLIDLQNDFFPGGALAVPEANKLFPLVNDIQDVFSLVVASKDWHPLNHQSFASNHAGYSPYEIIMHQKLPQVLWPNHCVQNTFGAEFYPLLKTEKIQKNIYKGMDPNYDSYSAFFDNAHQNDTGLNTYLKEQKVMQLFILGLATEYCVKYSVLDALLLGYSVYLIQNACFGINKEPNDVQKALSMMTSAGAQVIHSNQIKQFL